MNAQLAALSALFALAACGGGGGSTASAPPPATGGDAVLSVTIAGGASPGIDHLWITITGLAISANANAVYGDGSWVNLPLAAPVTLDLAASASTPGQLQQVVKQSVSQLGSYAQLRLLLASPDPGIALTASAAAAGLATNDEVQYTDAGGAHAVPLELPALEGGLRLTTPFTLSADTYTPLAIEWSAQATLVPRASLGGARFAVRDELELYDQSLLTALGGDTLTVDGSVWDSITGQLDTSNFCSGTTATGCIHDVVASATLLSADGRFHREVRSVGVPASGAFALYPLPSESLYDVVIRGANMQTIVVRQVFVDPTALLRPFPTELSSTAHPIVPVLDTSGSAFTAAAPLSPAAGRLYVGRTISGSGGTGGDVPYVVAAANSDPITGLPAAALALPGGTMQVAVFDPQTDGFGTPPTFTPTTPAEGAGAYSVWTRGTSLEGTSALAILPAGATGLAPPAAPRLSAFAPATLTVTVGGASSNGADRAELIVVDDGGIVVDQDVSSLVAAGGAVPVAVASGTLASAPGATVYTAALRTWKSGAETSSVLWRRAASPVDLSGATSGSVSLALP